MNTLIDMINDVRATRSPSGSNISIEVSKTLKYFGMIQALSCTFENLNLDNLECVKIANGIVKTLESLTVEHVQGHEDAQHKSSNLGVSGSNVHQHWNERENEKHHQHTQLLILNRMKQSLTKWNLPMMQ